MRKRTPERRPLKIYALDPLIGGTSNNRLVVDVPYERLRQGPVGRRLRVVDFDGVHRRYYEAVDLDAPEILLSGGLDPSEADPRFHQQMVYAVAAMTLESFERALGRRVPLARGGARSTLTLIPHAFHGANAYYDPSLHAIMFGYFRASRTEPGLTLPGQNVFTCLSHDIIAHEMAHALVHQLRPLFNEASNADVIAFHEGFADVVALFQHFSFVEILHQQIQASRTNLRDKSLMAELAIQFGQATGVGDALRSAIRGKERLSDSIQEPHRRGAILLAALFDAYFAIYESRIRDLIRIATGGTGNLPDADLHPDLVRRIAQEAASAARSLSTMCIRAFDYLPPVDITFGDYLRALITADVELAPLDSDGHRAAIIEAFRSRAIYPEGVRSLADESLIWDAPESISRMPIGTAEMLRQFVQTGVSISKTTEEIHAPGILSERLTRDLRQWATDQATSLFLNTNTNIEVRSANHVFRVAPDGQLLLEFVAQFEQLSESNPEGGTIPVRGGTTVVADGNGDVRYVIAKPLPSSRLPDQLSKAAKHRVDRQRDFVSLDRHDGFDCAGNAEQRRAHGWDFLQIHQVVGR
jgi:hypothetical protein